jgi:CheY-like chemotaxis protein
LAEDNPADAFLVEEALSLTNLNFTLMKAINGEAASLKLANLEQDKVEVALILLDLNLPKISGHQLLTQVRTSEYLRSTPVIVLTSSDSPQDRLRAAALHVSYYFRKPSDLGEFMKLGNIVETIVLNR